MKKIFLGLAVFFAATTLVSAQKGGAFEKGDLLLNAGIGIGTYYGYDGGIAVGASLEYGVTDFISVGGQMDIYSSKFNYAGTKYKWTYVPIAGRGSYHFGKHFLKVENLDLYAGLALGYFVTSNDLDDGVGIDDNGGKFFVDPYAGARYYFKPNFGVFGEVGAGVSALKLGVSFKF